MEPTFGYEIVARTLGAVDVKVGPLTIDCKYNAVPTNESPLTGDLIFGSQFGVLTPVRVAGAIELRVHRLGQSFSV